MERRGDGQQHRALGAGGLGDLDRPLDRRLRSRDHHLAAAVVVGRLADRAGRDRVARRLGGDRSSPRRNRGRGSPPSRLRRPEPPAASPRRAGAAAARRPRGVSAPAAQRAEYSPSEWPATKAASRAMSSPASLSSARSAARLIAISAGCALAVSVSSASGPSKSAATASAERRVDPLEHLRARPGTPRRAPCPCRPSASPGPETPKPSSSKNPAGRAERHSLRPRCQANVIDDETRIVGAVDDRAGRAPSAVGRRAPFAGLKARLQTRGEDDREPGRACDPSGRSRKGTIAMTAAPGKSCGSCTMCCSALEIPEFKKPAGPPCAHCIARRRLHDLRAPAAGLPRLRMRMADPARSARHLRPTASARS